MHNTDFTVFPNFSEAYMSIVFYLKSDDIPTVKFLITTNATKQKEQGVCQIFLHTFTYMIFALFEIFRKEFLQLVP